SGALVSPHVIVTAAHCLPDGISVKVYGGANLLVAGVGDFRPTQAVYTHPSFDENNPQNGFDIGAVVLTNAINVAPLPMNRAPLTGDAIGKTVQVTGYGLPDAKTKLGAGQRRTALLELAGFDARLISLGDPEFSTCNGDSGGPALMAVGGQPTIIGITSFGPGTCSGISHDTRL